MPKRRRRPGAALAILIALCTFLSGCGKDDPQNDPQTGVKKAEVVRVPADAATISAAVDQVAEGGLVLVAPGTYREQVLLDVPDVTLRGEDRNGVVITGEGTRTAGVIAIADGVRIENLSVTDSLLYGVLVTGTHDGDTVLTPAQTGYDQFDPERFPPLQRFRVDHVTATNNGLYGIYAFNTQHGVIADSWASGSADSGYYVGQCRDCDIVVSGNVASRNAVGFENANASDSLTIVGNRFSDNRVGLTLTSNYQEAFVPQRANVVIGNVISDNAEPRSPAQADGGFGIGVGIAGGQDNLLRRNRITGNPTAAVVLSSSEDVPSLRNRLDRNSYAGNGVDLANVSHAAYPARGTCLSGAGVDVLTLLPQGLGLRCTTGADPATDRVPGPAAPEGLAFLDVPKPGTLPSLPLDATIPAPLPATIRHPDPKRATVPPADLLADLGRG